jgi:hypothetical protein
MLKQPSLLYSSILFYSLVNTASTTHPSRLIARCGFVHTSFSFVTEIIVKSPTRAAHESSCIIPDRLESGHRLGPLEHSIAPAAFGRSIDMWLDRGGEGMWMGGCAKNSHSFNFDLAFSGLVLEF